MRSFNDIRKLIGQSNFSDTFASLKAIIETMREMREMNDKVRMLQARYARILECEIIRVRTNPEIEVDKNTLISDILKFITILESKIPKDPTITETNIIEQYLQNFESYLTMNNYKPELDKGSPIRTYFYLREIYDTIEPIVLSFNSHSLKSSIQKGDFIAELSEFHNKIDEWITAFSTIRKDNSALLDHLQKVKSLYSDFRKVCLKSSSDMVFHSKKAIFFRSMNSLKIELEKWIGQAEKYRLS